MTPKEKGTPLEEKGTPLESGNSVRGGNRITRFQQFHPILFADDNKAVNVNGDDFTGTFGRRNPDGILFVDKFKLAHINQFVLGTFDLFDRNLLVPD